ncbi:hypothetical protein HKX48_001977 [Thoreauomyces humboldtii]|nr:hypothetical protein HKX48_001977 [Thoreauomyces humboldtii]
MVKQSALTKFRRDLGKRTGRINTTKRTSITKTVNPSSSSSSSSAAAAAAAASTALRRRVSTPYTPTASPSQTVAQKEYAEKILLDLELFAALPTRRWRSCPVSVGRNDGTWLSICHHFIRSPGEPHAEVLVDKWVALDEDVLKSYGVSKGSFVGYAANSRHAGTRLSWREACSYDQAHMMEMKDSAGYSLVKLAVHPRAREDK